MLKPSSGCAQRDLAGAGEIRDPGASRAGHFHSGACRRGRVRSSPLIAAITRLAAPLEEAFTAHLDADPITSLPALDGSHAATVLGEFGDDPNRFVASSDRRVYAGTAPVTRQSGKTRHVSP